MHSRWRRIKLNVAIYIVNHMLAGTRTYFFEIKRRLLVWAGWTIGKRTKIVGPIYVTSDLEIGEDTWVGRNFMCTGSGKVSIGSCCDIAPYVMCVTGSHLVGGKRRRAGEGYVGKISIGNGNWLCARCTILPNVSIGNGNIIAAGALVRENVGDDKLVAGVPARKIKTYDKEDSCGKYWNANM